MYFMKMSLLSILIFFFGMSMVVFGNINNTVDNSLKKESVVNQITPGVKIDGPVSQTSSLDFDPNYLSASLSEDDDMVIFKVKWVATSDFYESYLNPEVHYKLAEGLNDDSEGITLLEDSVYLDKGTDNESFLFTSEFDDVKNRTYYKLELIMNNKDFPFEEFQDYTLSAKITSSEGEYFRSIRSIPFTTPSKSIIDFTDETGRLEVKYDTVTINTSWEQAAQIDDDKYEIIENLQLTLTTNNDPDIPDQNIVIAEDPEDQKDLIVSSLSFNTEYTNWKIEGSYYNGVESIDLSKDLADFITSSGVIYDEESYELTEHENSITVELDIKNPAQTEEIYIEFYDNNNRLDSEMTLANGKPPIENSILDGYYTYEITGLDYNTEYNLYIQIVDKDGKLSNDQDRHLGKIKTIDIYPWVAPVDIVLLVIILVEIAAASSIYILLQRNQKK